MEAVPTWFPTPLGRNARLVTKGGGLSHDLGARSFQSETHSYANRLDQLGIKVRGNFGGFKPSAKYLKKEKARGKDRHPLNLEKIINSFLVLLKKHNFKRSNRARPRGVWAILAGKRYFV